MVVGGSAPYAGAAAEEEAAVLPISGAAAAAAAAADDDELEEPVAAAGVAPVAERSLASACSRAHAYKTVLLSSSSCVLVPLAIPPHESHTAFLTLSRIAWSKTRRRECGAPRPVFVARRVCFA